MTFPKCSFSCSCALPCETDTSAQQRCCSVHSFPDNGEQGSPPHRSGSVPWKCHHTVCICGCSLAGWHLTQSLRALRLYSSAPLHSYMDIMCSFQTKCPWGDCVWLTPPTLPAQPESTPRTHTHTHWHTHTILHCLKLLRLGTGELKKKKRPKWIWAMRISHEIWDNAWD